MSRAGLKAVTPSKYAVPEGTGSGTICPFFPFRISPRLGVSASK
jgi:hypothetical protein